MLTQQQRLAWLPTVDRLAQGIGQYTAYQLDEREYVGMVEEIAGANGVAELLEDYGYEFNGLSARKYHPDGDVPDDGSWRKVDPDNPRWQWHVHLFRQEGAIEVYSHYEYRPDLRPVADELWLEAIARCREHYRPTWDSGVDEGGEATYFLGAACDDVVELVGGDR